MIFGDRCREVGGLPTVEFPLDGGGHVLVRVEDLGLDVGGGDIVTRGGGMSTRLEQAQATFEAALDPIRVVAQGVLEKLAGLVDSPDEVHVEFGLELTAKAGAIVAAVGSTAQLKVGLTWRRPSVAPIDGGIRVAAGADR